MNPRSYFLAVSINLPVATGVVAMGIFIVDTITDLEIAVGALYVGVVLLSARFCPQRGVILVSLGCMVLTVLSGLLASTVTEAGLINGVIATVLIGLTAYLVLKIQSAGIAAHEAQAQLAHFSRVTTLGELLASIAHEVNQPLAAAAINGNTCMRWLAGRSPNLKEAKQAVGRVVKDVNRASAVISRIRSLTKRGTAKEEWLSINETILEVTLLMAEEIKKNHISLRNRLPKNLPLVFGDRIQLQQVILNLIVNAVEAMRGVADGERELVVSSANDGPKFLLIKIQDSGQGLEGGNFDHLFDAFHTTKVDGMGMGLTISRSIIEAHGGRLWAKPNAPRGAIFQFTLPLERAEP